MAEDIRREMRRLESKSATKKWEEKERRIKKEIARTIKHYQTEIKKLEKEVKEIYAREKLFLSQGKKFRAKIMRWRREGKQRKLAELKKITPSTESQ
ncbi:hypothetical protein ACFLZB_04985 [Nanoarchaeota archaeon]